MGEINTGAIKIQDNWFMKDEVKIKAGVMDNYGTTGYKFDVVSGGRLNSVALKPQEGSLASMVRSGAKNDTRYSYPTIDLLTGVEINPDTGVPVSDNEGVPRGLDDASLAYLREAACDGNLEGVDVEKLKGLMKNGEREKLPDTLFPLPEEILYNVTYKAEKLNGEIVEFFISSDDNRMYQKGRDGSFRAAGRFHRDDYKS